MLGRRVRDTDVRSGIDLHRDERRCSHPIIRSDGLERTFASLRLGVKGLGAEFRWITSRIADESIQSSQTMSSALPLAHVRGSSTHVSLSARESRNALCVAIPRAALRVTIYEANERPLTGNSNLSRESPKLRGLCTSGISERPRCIQHPVASLRARGTRVRLINRSSFAPYEAGGSGVGASSDAERRETRRERDNEREGHASCH